MTDRPQTFAEALADLGRGITDALSQAATETTFTNAATRALAACLDQDDDHVARILDGLTDKQLYAIEGAASALAIHASRLRPPRGEQAAAPQCPAQTGPVWKAAGEPCGCTLARGHDGDHQCECGAWFVDSVRRDGDWRGASTTGIAYDEITGLDRLAPWERDLLTAKATEQQPEPARVRTREDLAAELRAVERQVREQVAAEIEAAARGRRPHARRDRDRSPR